MSNRAIDERRAGVRREGGVNLPTGPAAWISYRFARVLAARFMGTNDFSEAQLQSELEIAWVEGAPSLSEIMAIQAIIAAGADVLRAQLEVGVVENENRLVNFIIFLLQNPTHRTD
jgi:hypothetical protein